MYTSIITLALAVAAAAKPVAVLSLDTPAPIAVPSIYDGKCYYPTGDSRFNLKQYLGRWYQVAATNMPFTAGCTCVFAEYSLNAQGTVNVFNSCQLNGKANNISGVAVPAPAQYGSKGVLKVSFPGQPNFSPCQGPNYIVQDYEGDFAIVQAPFFADLFILSRKQNPTDSELNSYLSKAQSLGANLTMVSKTTQTGCKFT